MFVPDDWRTLIRTARRKNPFIVREMKREDFLNIKVLMKYIINRKKDTKKEKVEWLKMLWIRVEKSNPFRFKFRTTHNELEVWQEVPSSIERASMTTLYDGQ